MTKYLMLVDEEVYKIDLTEDQVIEEARNLLQELLKDPDVDEDFKENYKDYEFTSFEQAKKFLKDYLYTVVEDKDTECSLLVQRMLDKDEVIKIKTRSDGGYWDIEVKALLDNPEKREVLFQIVGQRMTPSGCWDNGIEKCKRVYFVPRTYKTLDELVKIFVQHIILYRDNKEVDHWKLK